jgi:hypothetical protein
MPSSIPSDYSFPSDLPAELVELLRTVDRDSMDAVVDAAFAAVAYPPGALLPAERLTPAQRALVQTLVECRIWSPSCRGRLPDREDLRRWLGLEAPDAFQESVELELHGVRHREPLWRAIWLLRADDYASKTETAAAFTSALPLATRYELWGRCLLRFPSPWRLDAYLFFPLDAHPERCAHLVDGAAHAWAASFLDQLLAAKSDGAKGTSTLLPFLELVRAKVPIEPRWYALLPTSGRHDLVDEVLFSIPAERRAEAVQRWLSRMLFPNDVVKAVTRVLPRMPDPAMLARALDAIPKATGSALLHRRALREAAGTHAELLALLDAAEAAAGPPMVLTLLEVRKPTRIDELSPEDQAQLLVAGKRYHGKPTGLEDLLNVKVEDRGLFDLTVLTIGDAKGKHVYDGWLYMVDAGCFFAKGKPRVVAERVQFGIECKNEKLGDALETLLRAPLDPPAPRAKKSAAKAKPKAAKKPKKQAPT